MNNSSVHVIPNRKSVCPSGQNVKFHQNNLHLCNDFAYWLTLEPSCFVSLTPCFLLYLIHHFRVTDHFWLKYYKTCL